jgi:DNA replication and repair protein RecF
VRLTELSARSFRNLSPDPVFFGPGVTLVSGENAQGKTNLLEAVALVCGQRSFRGASPAEMAGSGAEGFRIEATVRRSAATERLRVDWSREKGRTFARGQKASGFREISTLAPAVFLTPEHRDLPGGPPVVRRRFLDRLVLNLLPAAGDDLARFERALAERNALLARIREGKPAGEELEAWTEELVRAGAAVRRHRREALSRWEELFRASQVAAGPEYSTVSVVYDADGDTEEDLRRALSRVSSVERRRGYTLAGPHRDDLVWSRRGRPIAASASSGEIHRLVAMAKLAEWRAVAQAAGETPLLAIDDFDAGLSENSVRALLGELPDAETILLTTASEPSRWGRLSGRVMEMRAGRILDRPRAVND